MPRLDLCANILSLPKSAMYFDLNRELILYKSPINISWSNICKCLHFPIFLNFAPIILLFFSNNTNFVVSHTNDFRFPLKNTFWWTNPEYLTVNELLSSISFRDF
eukprot:NODE_398_length_8105_cov_1.375094.p11 type:complete len:105 gc:universal NODE_398_length_8105_cov_1.375094:5019-5333(+)